MFELLLLLSVIGPASAWTSLEDWVSGNVTVSVGDSGQCLCHVYLPDTTFSAGRVEHMQQVTKDLILEVNIQIEKIDSYDGKLGVFLSELENLDMRVKLLERNPDKYVKLDFELLRTELREFEALVTELHEALNGSSPTLDSLYVEIRNMTLIVDRLEGYDKGNLDVVRLEFAKLKKKLDDCQKELEDIITPDIGNCDHQGIISLSKPMAIQLNADLDSGYRYGGWGKDSKPAQGSESMYWYGGYPGPSVQYLKLYSDYDKLILRSSFEVHNIPRDTGNNYIVHGNAMYYQYNSPFSMSKFNLNSSKHDYRVIPDASRRFSYSNSSDQNMDFAADENGLWVIYATEQSKGKLVVAKIDMTSFGIENVWSTGAYKPLVGNAFMVCGVMYATRPLPVSPNSEEIFYSYDTRSGQERQLSIPFEKFQQSYYNLHYNPADQKLYMYNDGYYVSYDVKFN
ncbi:olfactomedin-4 [Gadus macrocephalus]|uniref:olfactomedin-4 n=1 Tax=Gadus macrocephalus TaxID=80720 RepID=UPI0028CB8708|nr:olfactomedin-4 [Gadus macrocephalus]